MSYGNWAGDTFPPFGYAETLSNFVPSVHHTHFANTRHSLMVFSPTAAPPIPHRNEKYVALKVVKSATHYTETAADEIRLLEVIRDAAPTDPNSEFIVRLINHFTVRGVNGVHTCLVFEALGCSLYKLIVRNNYQGLALPQVKSIIKQVCCCVCVCGAGWLCVE